LCKVVVLVSMSHLLFSFFFSFNVLAAVAFAYQHLQKLAVIGGPLQKEREIIQ